MDSKHIENFAAIQYVGVAGVSADCQEAVYRFVQFGDKITDAKILTFENDHCLLLTIGVGDIVGVKSGFASGYGGEGPRTFSSVLQVLDSLEVEIEEYEVSEEFLRRLDASALTTDDLDALASLRPKRPRRWAQYIEDRHFTRAQDDSLWRFEFPPVIPLNVIDPRIMKLSLSFWDEPDHNLLVAYRRLEDIVRARTGLDEFGTKLFSKAFASTGGILTWKDIDPGERNGRMQLFAGVYSAHRNPRAHREPKSTSREFLSEFLVLNHLYLLEAQAIPEVEPSA